MDRLDAKVGKLVREERCSLGTARRIAAMLDLDDGFLHSGGPLPRGWQFVLLAAGTPRSSVRRDGFPGFGLAFEGEELASLVIVGRKVRFHRDITIDAPIRRETTLEKVRPAQGASGRSVLVTVAHELHDDASATPLLRETQTYLLRERTRYEPAPPAGNPPAFEASHTPDDILLFQYSALGFNSHKIHIDRSYARDVEGFPDLVVNGGLSTLLLTEFARCRLGLRLAGLSASHLSPLFCDRPMRIASRTEGGELLLEAYDEAGRLAARVAGEIEP
ncbi:hypothetical protein [Aureimonas populi]|uniref:N-terminal of MaoC-like dehydratase domain-containing protein n=1 Tax=Aureimonas populi TaxID=1701758 RepID=A0ABW5CTX9_9HYPH|nr:hypothetical protein [Aureimonas populi]